MTMPTGRWTLDDGSGTVASDSSGNGNAGTLINGPAWAAGKLGGGLAFDGVNDYVSIGDPVVLRPGNAITLASWMFLDDAAVTRFIIAKDDDSAPQNATYLRYQAGGRIGCAVGGTQLLATAGIVAGQWYNLACTYDGSMVRAYVNGVLKGSVAKTGAIADEIGVSWLIGARKPASPAIFMKGRLDDVRIYDVALSATEVAALFTAETPVPLFQTPSQWATFDPSANGVGVSPKGYNGTVVAGQYIYFVPFMGLSEVLRFDTTQPFSSPSAWAAFDPQPPSGGGYAGAGAFDGRYIYFAPWGDGITSHGEVLRYDTTAPFDSASSWSTFSPNDNGVGTDPRGYWGAFFDGQQYIYFAPEWKSGGGHGEHGEVMRYDTLAPFDSASSWQTFDAGANGVGIDPDGYKGIGSDGRYLYFVPYYNGTASHGEFLRYDSTGAFDSASSWTTYTPGANGVGTIAKGFEDAIFDGRYLYFVPSYAGVGLGAYHGEVLRFDTRAQFNAASSWTAFDPGSNGVGFDPDGYNGGIFDGQYVYFVPTVNGTTAHGEVLRYDTFLPFGAASSWLTFIPGANGIGTDPRGYAGAAFVGQYIYFAPNRKSGSAHGEVMRYDMVQVNG